jgi:hypothetical protein
MSRIILGTMLAVGVVLTTCENARSQEHKGWPEEGALHWTPNQQAVPNAGPAIRNEKRAYDLQPEGVRNWRYNFHNNRWWYWTPENKWVFWNDGRWQDYADAGPVPYTSNYRGPMNSADLSGWYWRNSDKHWYWFDGQTLQAAP